MKLSPNMQKALDALPLIYTTWGFPKGVTMATIEALRNRGLVKIIREGSHSSHKKVVKVEK